MAAGALLVQEAGGLIGDFNGGHDFLEKGHIVAGNPKCFRGLLTQIQPHLPPRSSAEFTWLTKSPCRQRRQGLFLPAAARLRGRPSGLT